MSVQRSQINRLLLEVFGKQPATVWMLQKARRRKRHARYRRGREGVRPRLRGRR